MHDYSPNDAFPAARLLDTSDPVLGGTGATGASNEPLYKLADRTEYLYNRLGRYLGHRIVTANDTITTADVGKLVQAVKNNNMTLTLDPVAGFKVGAWIKFKAKITATANTGKAVLIAPNGGETILDSNSNTALYLCDGDEVTLVAADSNSNGTADYWEAIDLKGNFDKVGIDQLVRYRPRNTILADGLTLLTRADYPRLAAVVLFTAVSDATWSSDIRYKQFWSTGNGTTTMRPPDMRSMVHKGLDMGRGLSLSRLDNVDGGLELDAVKRHDHSVPGIPLLVNDVDRGNQTSKFSVDNIDTSKLTGTTGDDENLIKTIGFTPVIYY